MANIYDQYDGTDTPEAGTGSVSASGSNIYDSFDNPAPNVYDQFDGPHSPAAGSNAVAPPQPQLTPKQGGYPTADNQLDLLAYPGLTAMASRFAHDVVSGQGSALSGTASILREMDPLAGNEGMPPLPGAGTGIDELRQAAIAQPLEQNPVYQAGQAVKGFADQILPQKQTQPNVMLDVAGGLGSMAGGFPALLAGPAAAIPYFAAQGVDEATQNVMQAKAAGKPVTPEQLRLAGILGSVPGVLDAFDMAILKAGGVGAGVGLLKKLGGYATTVLLEGGQEGFQQFLQNVIQKNIYNPSTGVFDQVAYNALIGGLTAGVAHPVFHALSREGKEAIPSDEQVAAVFGGGANTASVNGDIPAQPPAQATSGVGGTEATNPTVQPAAPDFSQPAGPDLGPEPPPHTEIPTAPDQPSTRNMPKEEFDVGFGNTISKQGDGSWALVDDAGKVITSAPTFGEVSTAAKTYLDTGQIPAMPKVVPTKAVPISTPPEAPTNVVPLRGPATSKYVSPVNTTFTDSDAQRAAYNFLTNTKKLNSAQISALRGKPEFGGDVVSAANSLGFTTYKPKAAGTTESVVANIPGATPPNVLGADVVEFMSKQRPQVKAPVLGGEVLPPGAPTPPNLKPVKQEVGDPLRPSREEISANPGVNQSRVTDLLGASLYGDLTESDKVTLKELFQNSYDAIRKDVESGKYKDGNIRISMDPKTRKITIYDDGSGMAASTLANEFLEVAGTKKESGKSTGGFGIAKLVSLYANQALNVVTMRDGKVSQMSTSGPDLKRAMDKQGPAPKITIRDPTSQDMVSFPRGHGTIVQVTIPEAFVDAEGTTKKIEFENEAYQHPVLAHSPLLSNINVTFNNRPVAGIGSTFELQEYVPLLTVQLPWGKARISMSKDPDSLQRYGSNTHVLGNGLWQFSTKIAKNPTQSYSEGVERTFFIDLDPSVRPGKPGYPFDLNRQKFTDAAKYDIAKIMNHISALFRYQDLRDDATNFGHMSYLNIGNDGKVSQTKPIEIKPKKPHDTPIQLIKPGDVITIKNEKMMVNGKELPEVDINALDKALPDTATLTVDQSEINPKQVMLHDNTLITISELEKKGVVELAQEKFGQRFNDFVHAIGIEFQLLRDNLAKDTRWGTMFKGIDKTAVGISFDKEYRGVNIRVPFSGQFINPAVPERTDPLLAGVMMVGTMIHELAHFNIRSHDAAFPQEMQRINAAFITLQDFNLHEVYQRVVNTIGANSDIFTYINGLYSGAYNVESRGNRFKEPGSYEAANDRVLGAVAQTSGRQRGLTDLLRSTRERQRDTQQGAERQQSYYRVEETGGVDPTSAQRGNTANLRQLDPGLVATYPQSDLAAIKQSVAAVAGALSGGGGGTPGTPSHSGSGGVAQLGIHADRINRFYKWTYGSDRLADLNPRAAPFLRFNERMRQMRYETSRWHDSAMRIMKLWRRLSNSSNDSLMGLIDDVSNMVYRTPTEVKRGIRRHPSPQEFAQLVNKHKVSKQALEVFALQKDLFGRFLEGITQNAYDTAIRTIQDPVFRAQKIDQITAQRDNLASAPYFPFMRFGQHFITVRDAAGRVKFFQTYENQGFRSAQRVQMAALAKITAGKTPGDVVEHGVLPETAAHFVGLPPALLDSIATEMNLTPQQKIALDQLRYQYAPAASFTHHWQNKNYTKGYSADFKRAFSRYFFHGGRYFSRSKYVWELRELEQQQRAAGGNKNTALANYMQGILQNNILDAKGDFGLAKGFIFLWTFGYAPVGAAINLSQIPLISYPFMASRFGGVGIGDTRATAALTKAMLQLSNFYKRGKYENQTAFELKALDYGIRTGRITEAMASELAGAAQGNNLFGDGRTTAERGFNTFMEKAAWMFEMAEQFNRRVTYRAALDLAMKHPNSRGVHEALNKYADEYNQLLTKGFNPSEAAAIITAAHTTEQTQFVYARENRPAFMQGRTLGTVLVFKTYLVNVLQLLGANKSSVLPRYMLMMMMLGGVQGLPGMDDLEDIIQILGRKLYGKDFNVRLALRQLILDVSNGTIPPDLILHGLARKGFGIPAAMDMLGEAPPRGLGQVPDSPRTRALYLRWAAEMKAKGSPDVMSYEAFRKQHSQNVPAPQVDMSASIGMGRLLPFDLGKLYDPNSGDANMGIAATAQQASGAVFSVGFNAYKAFQDEQTPTNDFKRWEKVMPRAVASASRAYRAYYEGRERTKGTGPAGSASVVRYDVHDPEQAMEMMALAAGFMPTRVSNQWDSIAAQAEVQAKFKFEKQLLEGQFFEAVMSRDNDKKEVARQAIIKYNSDLPEWARGQQIQGQQLMESVNARMKQRVMREAGLPPTAKQVPTARHVQGLFPESVVDIRPVQ